ncbi:chymotrypsin-2 [Drosophila bipectinata]|uniref:chymotrypsin-2 n=1 Tax=Drosophila bipectinata TaxID=42026 RepID=UPI001C8ADCB4|nr:chymotrypsin-2 [Drosophila bipectinata]
MILQFFLFVPITLGFAQDLGSLRIMNGTYAVEEQFPYEAGLLCYFAGFPNNPSLCGGAILSNRWILTAAHCLQDPDANLTQVRVQVGSLEAPGGDDILVNGSDIIVHKNFNRKTVFNDLGLIRLPKNLTFSSKVQPVKLPSSYRTYTGRSVFISGWGLTDNQTASESLQYLRTDVVSNKQCQSQWNKALKGKKKKVVSWTFVCVDTQQGMPCQGDSGSPMVLADGSKTLVGIVSHGLDPECKRKVPDISMRVSAFLRWINSNTGGLK